MAINLQKGQAVSLTKANNNSALTNVTMGLGWDAFVLKEERKGGFLGFGGNKTGNKVKVPCDVDLDASCVTMDKKGNVLETICFNNLFSRCGSIRHKGDNLTGAGDGDDEQIKVDLARLPEAVTQVFFTVNAYSSVTFNDVHNAHCRLLDSAGKEVVAFPIASTGDHTAMIMAKVTRQSNGDWEFVAIGEKAQGRTVSDLTNIIKRLA